MFIKKLFGKKLDEVSADKGSLYREENVIWASEGIAEVGAGITIGECQRSLFYKFLGQEYTNPMSVRVRHICDAGIMYEDSIINEFKKNNLYVDEQVRMEYISEDTIHKVITSGKMDLLINENNKNIGIEIKSISSYKVDSVFGTNKKIPLPAPKNLIQAMHYKKRSLQGPVLCSDGKERNIEEVYLLYIDRSTGSLMYFKVDLDDEEYAIITPVDEAGNEFETIHLQQVDSFDELLHHSTTATKDQSRLAELRFSLRDIIAKFDSVYNYVREQHLPDPSYKLIYNNSDVDLQYHCGRISKIKYNKHYKKHEPIGDMECAYCNFKDKCMADSGITLAQTD